MSKSIVLISLIFGFLFGINTTEANDSQSAIKNMATVQNSPWDPRGNDRETNSATAETQDEEKQSVPEQQEEEE